jgi:hypothetical protein
LKSNILEAGISVLFTVGAVLCYNSAYVGLGCLMIECFNINTGTPELKSDHSAPIYG